MAKLTGDIIYGIENKEKLNRIINSLSVKPVKWDDLSLEFFGESREVGEDKLLGHTDKHFYRANVSEMQHLIDEIQNNDTCSYVTPINDVIKENLIPEKVSTLLKHQSDFKAVNEVVSSQILNLFGVPTCYNFLVTTDNKYDSYVGSVDMLSGNQRFYTLNDFFNLHICIDNFLYEDHIYKKLKSSDNVVTEKYGVQLKFDEEELKKQLIYTFLVRICLLSDSDFTSDNIGFLVDVVTGEIKLVNFDLELTLMLTNYMDNVINRSLHAIYGDAPEIFEQFISQVCELDRVIKEVEINCISDQHRMTLTQLEKNINTIMQFNKKMKDSTLVEANVK